MRRYVGLRKRELGLKGREVFVPQSYSWGQEGQVDWFEAVAKLGGERCKLQFFAMRSMASGDAFHRAYTNATQQAFLDAHEHAFDYFDGVFRTLRYDNLASAVKKILRGRQRVETERDHRLPVALGIPERVLQSGERQRKRRRGRRTRLVSAQLAGAGSGGRRSGKSEPAVAGGVRGEPEPHDHRQGHAGGRSLPDGTAAPAAAGGGRLRDTRNAVSADRGRQGTREGKDQLVFGSVVAGPASDGAGLAVVDQHRA